MALKQKVQAFKKVTKQLQIPTGYLQSLYALSSD